MNRLIQFCATEAILIWFSWLIYFISLCYEWYNWKSDCFNLCSIAVTNNWYWVIQSPGNWTVPCREPLSVLLAVQSYDRRPKRRSTWTCMCRQSRKEGIRGLKCLFIRNSQGNSPDSMTASTHSWGLFQHCCIVHFP